MGIIDDIGGALDDGWHHVEDTFGELTNDGAVTAPPPQITSKPTPAKPPQPMKPQDVSAHGQVTVQPDALVSAADMIKSQLPALNGAISEIKKHSGAFDSLMGWSTGQAFGGNMTAAVDAFSNAGTQTGEAHSIAGDQLQGSSDTYREADANSAQTASSVQSQLPSGGGAPASGGTTNGGNWSTAQ
ncbi:MAG: hypothetical protein J2P25_13465 [Nocardiopsaceae bacterium]|nr:hypothetical protein [Nocardiopsaceae bacterium]